MAGKEEYQDACRLRTYMRSRVTRLYNKVNAEVDQYDDVKKNILYGQFAAMKDELTELNIKIHLTQTEDQGEEVEEAIMQDEMLYEERLIDAMQMTTVTNANPNPPPNSNPNPPPNQSNKIKLPTIALPTFSNLKTESLEKFLHALEAILSKQQLSEYEKFVYLKGQLSRGPLSLINSLEPEQLKYSEAKKLLKEAFASEITQQYEAIQKLSTLRLGYEDDVYAFISEMRNLISSFKNLKIDSDMILQYFIWHALNDKFQNQLMNIINKSKPSLTEINQNIFMATERYLKLQEQFQVQKEAFGNYSGGPKIQTNNLAINVQNKKMILCNLCLADRKKDINHTLRDCNVYLDAWKKVKKLESLNYCSRCSFRNHSKYECKFKFTSTCRKCRGQHLTYLCTYRENRDQKPSTSNWLSCVHFKSTVNHDNILLPAFSIKIRGDSRNWYRVLSDSGSQRNFILESVAKKLKLTVTSENIELLVHGFNSDKNLITDVVEVPILVDEVEKMIECIVIPNINITLTISDLQQITNSFLSKGYILADKMIHAGDSTIGDFSMIMGCDATKVLSPNTKFFGEGEDQAVYLDTSLGVILLGESEMIKENLRFLPDKNVRHARPPCIHSKSTLNHIKSLSTEVNLSNVSEISKVKDYIADNSLEVTDDFLLKCAKNVLNYHDIDENDSDEMNEEITHYVLSNTERTAEGRLITALPWNSACKNQLSQNFHLSKQILYSNLKKLKKDNVLNLYDQVFKEQEDMGIIERIEDVYTFMRENPEASFLPHMGVYNFNKSTTKVRVVYLSNLAEKGPEGKSISHNHALHPGPCLNNKILTSLILSRFDKYILIFDIAKAFLGIKLKEEDSLRLITLWFRAIENNDFKIIAYRNLRLPFGLRPSPAILMISLYKMLILDTEDDEDYIKNLKRMIYANIYMDNALVSTNNRSQLFNYYELLPQIFGNYQFQLQQWVTNADALQDEIDQQLGSATEDKVKFFGMFWHRRDDKLGPYPLQLDCSADTKRKVLATLNTVYDLFNVYIPILNRAKLYLQGLLVNKKLQWDTVLNSSQIKEWKLIAAQANSSPEISLRRFVGSREGSYNLVAFTDSSAAIYGVVIYIVERDTGNVNYLLSKNRVVGTKLKQTIPALEFQGVAYGVELLIDLYNELCSSKAVLPIKIYSLFVYTDSMVTVSWIKNQFLDCGKPKKLQKKSAFVTNRLKQIGEMCKDKAVTFRYIEGRENPADCVTRCFSYNKLKKTSFYTGPKFLDSKILPIQPDIEVTVPQPNMSTSCFVSVPEEVEVKKVAAEGVNLETCLQYPSYLVNIEDYSSYSKLIKIYTFVFKFLNNLKKRIKLRSNTMKVNNYTAAITAIIKTDQILYFSDIVEFFKSRNSKVSKAPSLVYQMNLYLDKNDIIRVKGKFTDDGLILLHYNSYLTKLIIVQIHERLSHAGKFLVLSDLRGKFWLLRGFSTVKKILGHCTICRKVNARPIKLNMNSYRDFRANPPKIPFSYIFIDHIGPINIKINGKVCKSWILILTCLYSRAISLEISYSADTREFMRCIQLHVYRYGLFSRCYSDMGSQIVRGSKLITEWLNSAECKSFFETNSITVSEFSQYPKGNSSLGSLVENCVKQTKHLIVKSIGKNILNLPEFQLLIAKTNHIINRRPIAFKEFVSDSVAMNEVPSCLTPEMLIYSRRLLSLDIIPDLNLSDETIEDPDFELIYNELPVDFKKLQKCNAKLVDLYHREFLLELMAQAVSKHDKYKPVPHTNLKVGDIVLLVEPYLKQYNYPLGIVKSINVNTLNEVTSAEIFKGGTRETVFRHVTSLILLLSSDLDPEIQPSVSSEIDSPPVRPAPRENRLAKLGAKRKITNCIK